MFLTYPGTMFSATAVSGSGHRIRDRFEGATKMKRKSLRGSVCAVARALDVIGDWWSLLIIYEAIAGPKRFGELERTLGKSFGR
jgi:hypothetical protein